MDHYDPYNPLDIVHLGESIFNAMVTPQPAPVDAVGAFVGGGIYAIYYTGQYEPYSLLAEENRDGKFRAPLYVGKAVPAGARKGINVTSGKRSHALSKRLREHAASLRAAQNLDTRDFWVRWLVIEPIWIPLGEQIMIARHTPLWNSLIDGFGNHDPGSGRISGIRSRWDTLHPGRPFAPKFPERHETQANIEQDVREHLRQRLGP